MVSQASSTAQHASRGAVIDEAATKPKQLVFRQPWSLQALAFGGLGFLLMGGAILFIGRGHTRLLSAALLIGLGSYLLARSLRVTKTLLVTTPDGKLKILEPWHQTTRSKPLGRCTGLELGVGPGHADYALWGQLETGQRQLIYYHRNPDLVLRRARQLGDFLGAASPVNSWRHPLPEESRSTGLRQGDSRMRVVHPYRSRGILTAALLVTLDLVLLTLIKLRDGMPPGWVTLVVPAVFLTLVMLLAVGTFVHAYRIQRTDRIVVERWLGPWLRARWEFPINDQLSVCAISPNAKRFPRHWCLDDGHRSLSIPVRPKDLAPLAASIGWTTASH